ncbi:MAG: glycoside hydrolase family 76 protein [Tannerellaceae bacterium]|nr:glycoside hydrolase family 76 protein [Tannerellaceae bacterium]
MNFKFISCVLLIGSVFISCNKQGNKNQETGLVQTSEEYSVSDCLSIADTLLNTILDKYEVKKYGLLLETYPVNPDHTVSYLAEGAEQKKEQEVSFLWPYSGMPSGLVALYKQTGEEKYLHLIEQQIIPGLQLYWDHTRLPACYQSYPLFNGESDRFYDDNDWLAIDFCDLYELTGKKEYLQKAIDLHTYIYSGWDDKLEGGIYWCEQQQTSKNTCSNAPAAVLCMKLYKQTGETKYLDQAKETYSWTKKFLEDPQDHVYWDNIRLDGGIGKEKYTYNSGQMIQAAVLLYEATKDDEYLQDARQTAAGSYSYFVSKRTNNRGGSMEFYPDMPWFNVILLRGLVALAPYDTATAYIQTMKENVLYAWNYTRDENGLLGNHWSGVGNSKYKWLLDNACMLELYAEICEF